MKPLRSEDYKGHSTLALNEKGAGAGLEDVKFHDLRRTFGTICVFKNVPPKTLQKWLGHKSIETTMKYYVVSPEDFEQEAIKRLAQLPQF